MIRRQQSLGDKLARKAAPKSKLATPKNDKNKVTAPFEYSKNNLSETKGEHSDKRTPNRSKNASPKMRFLSPTMSSKSKQSATKNSKNKAKNLYTIEDLENRAQYSPGGDGNTYQPNLSNSKHSNDNSAEKSAQNVSKKLNMDHVEPSKQDHKLVTGYKAFEYEQDEHEKNFQNLMNGKIIGLKQLNYTYLDTEEEAENELPEPAIQSNKHIPKANIDAKYNSDEFQDFDKDALKNRYSTEFRDEISFPEHINEIPKQVTPPKLRMLEESKNSSPGKNDSKGHQEIVSMLSNPNMLFNDASSIKYNSIDNQNMSNFSLPSLAGDIMKPSFDGLDGI